MPEVFTLFAAIKSVKYKAILATAYGARLRISEVCALKPLTPIYDADSSDP